MKFNKTTEVEPEEGQKCLVFMDGMYVVTYFTKNLLLQNMGFFTMGLHLMTGNLSWVARMSHIGHHCPTQKILVGNENVAV